MRKNELKKTNKPGVYEVLNNDGTKSFIVRFSHGGKRYGNKNFTKLYGCNTPSQAYLKLQEIKIMLSKEINPFENKKTNTLDSYFEDYLSTITNKKNHYSTETFYNKHIKHLGNKTIDKITEKDILNILNTSLKDKSNRTKKTLKIILGPIFKKALKNKEIELNPLEDIKFPKPQPKREITLRVADDLIVTVKKIYNKVLVEPDIERRIVFLFALMTARRRTEILQLEWADIKGDKVVVPESITKTNIAEEYPLPQEIIELLEIYKNINPKSKKIFSIRPDRVTKAFTQLVKEADIEMIKGQKITLHDTRNLFQSIMMNETFNPYLVDRCLSHVHHGSMLTTYLSFGYAKRKEVFERYWSIIRR